MKKINAAMIVLTMALCHHTIFAQEGDDVPYLSDEDIASIEMEIPEDVPESVRLSAEPEEKTPIDNALSRLNVDQPMYHLLILDRLRCPLNSDIGGIDSRSLRYKLKHGKNGYLIAIYKVPVGGPAFPILPNKSRIVLDLMTNRPNTIKEYVASSAFKRFVTNRTVLAQMLNVFKTKF